MKIRTFIGDRTEIWYDPESLEDTNRVREMDGKKPLKSLHGYCMSSGCSCRKTWGDQSKGWPICRLYYAYDEDGIKKDFINQTLGI